MNTERKLNYEELELENEHLKSRLKQIDESEKTKKKISLWFGKKASAIFVGKGLKQALKDSIDEFNTTKKISSENLASIGDGILKRVTRVGFVGVFISLMPLSVLVLQICLLSNQNDTLENQNSLIQY